MDSNSNSGGKLFDAFFWIRPTRSDDKSPFSSTEVLWHYPKDVSATTKEFRDIPQFCFPDLGHMKLESAHRARVEHYTFTLTDSKGKRVYGICMRGLFRGVGRRYDVGRRTRHCLCFISEFPYFSIFKAVLLHLHAIALTEEAPGRCAVFLDTIYNQMWVPVQDQGTENDGNNNGSNNGIASSLTQNSSSSSSNFLGVKPVPTLTYLARIVKATEFPDILRDIHIVSPSFLLQSSKGEGGNGVSGGIAHREMPILPLFELLGVDKFFKLFRAVACESQIVFVGDEAGTISSAVLSAVSMLNPFTWHHIFIPLIPHKLLSYASATIPFIIGVRRYMMRDLLKEPLENGIIVVDVDSGDIQIVGRANVMKDLMGDSGSALKQASESLDRVKSKATSIFKQVAAKATGGSSSSSNSVGSSSFSGSKGTLYGENSLVPPDQQPLYHQQLGTESKRDLMATIVADLKSRITATKPGSSSLSAVASGLLRGSASSSSSGSGGGGGSSSSSGANNKSSVEEAKALWALEAEKALRDTLCLFFVYLLADLTEHTVSPSGSGSSRSAGSMVGFGSNSPMFQPGDSRAQYDLQAFIRRRTQMGDSKELIEFLNEMFHTQMFERFCAELNEKSSRPKSGMGSIEAQQQQQQMEHQQQQQGEVYYAAVALMRSKRQQVTVSHARHAIVDVSVDAAAGGLFYHSLTMQYTSSGGGGAMMAGISAAVGAVSSSSTSSSSSSSSSSALTSLSVTKGSGSAGSGGGGVGTIGGMDDGFGVGVDSNSTSVDLDAAMAGVFIGGSGMGANSSNVGTSGGVSTRSRADAKRLGSVHNIEVILNDTYRSDSFLRVMKTIYFRLEACKSSSCRGNAAIAGVRTLNLLRVLLVAGSEGVLSAALDLVPLLYSLLILDTQAGGGGGGVDSIADSNTADLSSSSSLASSSDKGANGSGGGVASKALEVITLGGTVNVRPHVMAVLTLLTDQKKLKFQRNCEKQHRELLKAAAENEAAVAAAGGTPGNSPTKQRLQSLINNSDYLLVAGAFGSKQFPTSFAAFHASMNCCQQRSIAPMSLSSSPDGGYILPTVSSGTTNVPTSTTTSTASRGRTPPRSSISIQKPPKSGLSRSTGGASAVKNANNSGSLLDWGDDEDGTSTNSSAAAAAAATDPFTDNPFGDDIFASSVSICSDTVDNSPLSPSAAAAPLKPVRPPSIKSTSSPTNSGRSVSPVPAVPKLSAPRKDSAPAANRRQSQTIVTDNTLLDPWANDGFASTAPAVVTTSSNTTSFSSSTDAASASFASASSFSASEFDPFSSFAASQPIAFNSNTTTAATTPDANTRHDGFSEFGRSSSFASSHNNASGFSPSTGMNASGGAQFTGMQYQQKQQQQQQQRMDVSGTIVPPQYLPPPPPGGGGGVRGAYGGANTFSSNGMYNNNSNNYCIGGSNVRNRGMGSAVEDPFADLVNLNKK